MRKPTSEEREEAMENWQSFGAFSAIPDQVYNYDPRLANEAEALLIHPDLWEALLKTYGGLPVNTFDAGGEEYAEEGQGDSDRSFQGWTIYLSRDVPKGEVRLVV